MAILFSLKYSDDSCCIRDKEHRNGRRRIRDMNVRKLQLYVRDVHRGGHYNGPRHVHHDDHRGVRHDDPSHNIFGVQSVPNRGLRGEVRHEQLHGEGGGVDGDFHGGKRDGGRRGHSVQHDDLQLNDDEDSDGLVHGEGEQHDVHGVRAHGDRDHVSKLRGLVVEEHVPQEFQNVQECDGQVH